MSTFRYCVNHEEPCPLPCNGCAADCPPDAERIQYADDHSHVTDVPSPEADALDRIAELVKKAQADYYYRGATLAVFAALADDVATVVRETGRLP